MVKSVPSHKARRKSYLPDSLASQECHTLEAILKPYGNKGLVKPLPHMSI